MVALFDPGHDGHPTDFPAPARAPQRRPSKHERDPRDSYIRRVKGGKFQVRPYCPIVRERYELGCYDTIHEARTARDEFWRGKRPDLARFTRRVHTAAGERYFAVVVVPRNLLRGWWAAVGCSRTDRETIPLGPYLTRGEAAAAAQGVLAAACGPLFAAAAMAIRGKSYKVPAAAAGQPGRG